MYIISSTVVTSYLYCRVFNAVLFVKRASLSLLFSVHELCALENKLLLNQVVQYYLSTVHLSFCNYMDENCRHVDITGEWAFS